MAFNKAKALQEAHKYVAQEKIARAIKQYKMIAEKDPRDLILLNVIGDLYAREGKTSDALNYFYKLADAYSREGYNVKAIAIYKKISKLDRDKVDPLLRLAELQLAQGLAREAREQYRTVFEFFERTGQKEKALEMLRKLCQLSPKSPAVHLALAQYAERVGEIREAAEQYLSAASLARDLGETEAADNAVAKAGELAPGNPEVQLFRARQALAENRPEQVRLILDEAPDLQGKPQVKRLLLESDLATGALDAAREVLLEVFQSDPSDFSPIAAYSARCVEKQQYEEALEVLAAAAPEVIARRMSTPLMESLRELWKASPERIDTLEFIYDVAEKTADEATIPEVLEALGNAHVQRDQFAQAEKAYARLVAREPENETYKDLLRKVLEKQGKEYVPLSQTPLMSDDIGLETGPEFLKGSAAAGLSSDPEQAAIVRGALSNSDFFARDGMTQRAVEELEKVLHAYPDQREIHRRILELCREDHPARAVQAAEVLARICEEQNESSEAKRYHEEALELAQAAAGSVADVLLPTQETGSAEPVGASALSPATMEIDLSPPKGQEQQDAESQLPPPQDINLQFHTSQAAETAILPGDGAHLRQTTPTPAQQDPAEKTEAAPFNYEESRDEIEFYLRHGFHDEARKAMGELERLYPGEPRLAELQQMVNRSGRESSPIEKAQNVVGAGAEESAAAEWDLPTSFSGGAEAGISEEENKPASESSGEVVEGLASERASEREGLQQHSSTPAASVPPKEQTVSLASAADASAELGSLLDELHDPGETEDQADDEQTHYNLGVAFREMGLLDEAIGEFQKVAKGTSPYFLQGCTLLASCFMEKEMPGIAAKWYTRALEASGLDHEGRLALHYDLGVAYEMAGDRTAALEKFTEVYSQNIDYRDVAEKIHLLRQASR